MEIIFTLLVVIGILASSEPLMALLERLNQKRHYRKFLQIETYYHSIISPHLKFYNRLTSEEQHRFLFRTYLFQRSKRFRYIEVEESEIGRAHV